MNYNSIEEILSAGVTNMETIRDNEKLTGTTKISMAGVSWFIFNGVVASSIYISAYSFINFGTASGEQLRVNRGTRALYSLYREEGTLYNYYKFLKIRWSGYTSTTSTVARAKMEYDVILWDTGDISLHMVSYPTASNTGTYSLTESSTYTYTINDSSPDVTFKKTENGYEVSNNVIALEIPYEKRYLIRSDTTYYTVVDNSLSVIDGASLSSSTFLNSGVADIPSITLLKGLSNPEILYWHDSDKKLEAGLIVKGVPPLPQLVEFEAQDMSAYSGIERVGVLSSKHARFTVTFDNGASWKYYDGGKWVVALEESEGMIANILERVTSNAWSEVATSKIFRFRCALTSADSTTGQIYIKYR